MFCENCGKEIKDNAVYCYYCGEKQNQTIDIDSKRKKRKKLWLCLGAIATMFFIGGAVAYPKVSKYVSENSSKEKQIAQYEKNLEEIKQAYANCIVSDKQNKVWEEELEAFESIEKQIKNYDQIKDKYEILEEYLEKIEEKNKQSLKKQLKELKTGKMLYSVPNDMEESKKYLLDMEKFISNKQFLDANEVGVKWKNLIASRNEKQDGLSVKVVQEDYSDFPNIRLYLDIVDENGNVATDISQDMFFVSEKIEGNSGFTRATVKNASQLNEKEALNMNLVLDTSGSMDAALYDAKNIISNFIDSVQFQAGDSVRLTAFESQIYAKTDFLTNTSSLKDVLYSLESSGGTRLYDTLMRAVQDTNVRNGAKCVIAFTDGMDIESVNGPQDVIDTAKFYGIPIYIVRIGEDMWADEETALRQIAEGSGGAFYTSDTFNEEVGSIYSRIYRDMKQYYVVEYTTKVGEDISSNVEYEVYVRDGDKGGYNVGSYQASEDVFGSLYWNFLQAYISDMNNYKYSEMSNYIDSNIKEGEERTLYKQMQKQVSRGFEDVDYENLLTVDIKKIEKKGDIYLLYSEEEYDSVYTKTLEDLKMMKSDGWVVNRSSANQALQLLENQTSLDYLMEDDEITVHQVTHQTVVYQIRKASDEKWKFYKYDKNIEFENPDVYRVELNEMDL